MATYFKNPANEYIEKATGGWTWLWAFLFGPFYYLYKGAWPYALGYFGLVFFLGAMLPASASGAAAGGGIWLLIAIIFTVAAYPVVRKTYRRAGWIETTIAHEDRRRGPQPIQAAPALWTRDDRV